MEYLSEVEATVRGALKLRWKYRKIWCMNRVEVAQAITVERQFGSHSSKI